MHVCTGGLETKSVAVRTRASFVEKAVPEPWFAERVGFGCVEMRGWKQN